MLRDESAGPAATSRAQRALALVARETHDIPAALRWAELAAATARRSDDPALEGGALITVANVLTAGGRLTEALGVLADAAPLVDAAERPLLLLQRGTALQRLDRPAEAEASLGEAIDSAAALGAALPEAMARVNRGILRAYDGRAAAAERDLVEAEAIYERLGMDLALADARHNLGFVRAERGDLSGALALYDRARLAYDRLGVSRPNALLDEAQALLEANLVDEARAKAAAAAAALRAAGEVAHLAEALLLVAEAGGPDAEPAAKEAQALFAAQGRPAWSTLAAFRALRLEADVDADRARQLAVELDRAGWTDAAVEARLLAADRRDGARRADLALVAEHRRRGPAARRVRGWYAQALLALEDGDRTAAARAAAAGIRVASTHAVSLAATELRAHAGALVEPVVDLGVRLALDAGQPRQVLRWSERWRAAGVAATPSRTADIAELGALRAVLRRLQDDSLPTYRRVELDRRRRRLEVEVDRRTRSAAPGALDVDLRHGLDVAELRRQLADRTLLELVLHDGLVHPLTVDRRGVRLHEPRPLDELVREVRALRMAAARLARPGPAAARMAGATEAAAQQLDRLLLGGLPLGDRSTELVVVPSGPLHAVPWPLLPSLAGRPVTVAPSARLWLRAGEAEPAATGSRVLVVAHGVPGGSTEAEAVAAAHPGATVLAGDDATSERVLAALAEAHVAHLAVHATFRGDNPLYSSLHLADGPLLVHDLDRLPRTPELVVLAACGAAQTSVDAGDELLGLTASFLRSGTRTLVASTLPVADELAPPLMAAFHAGLRTARPALALRAATAEEPAAAGAAFTCLGRA